MTVQFGPPQWRVFRNSKSSFAGWVEFAGSACHFHYFSMSSNDVLKVNVSADIFQCIQRNRKLSFLVRF